MSNQSNNCLTTGLGMQPIFYFGSNELKAKYLKKLATCELIGTYALTEPNHGSDALGAETTAELSEDGKYYILNGQKVFSTNAGCSDVINTYAQIGDKFTAFVVENIWDGITLDAEEEKMGLHGSSTRGVNFNNVKVPVENVLGEIGKGHKVALYSLNAGRLKVGVGSLGWSKAVITEAINYAKKRIQFGVPIYDFGMIKYKISGMIIKTYVLESMV